MGTVQIDGSTPKITVGNATAEDALILFDGNAQDFHIGLDDTADDLVIGVGSALGTTTALAIDENAGSTFSGTVTVGVNDTGKDVKFFGATAGSYWLWDESADGVVQIGTITVGVNDAGHDVKFFGDAASAYMLWDTSADDLILAGAAGLSVAGATATAAITASGIIKTDDTTAATSTTDGSLQTDGGLSVALDAVIGDDLYMLSDASVIHFGADSEITLTHNADAGLTLGGTTPTLTIGDAGAEDTKIVFDGNAQDYHIGLDDSADDLVIGLGSTLGTTSHIVIDEAGTVTMPLQPAFYATLSSGQSVGATGNVDVVFDSERFDLNADFNVGTGVFTAPVTGKYHFDFGINFISHTSGEATVYFEPSNVEIRISREDALNATYKTFAQSIIIDMDAADTAFVRVHSQSGGDASYSIGDQSYFSGHLVA